MADDVSDEARLTRIEGLLDRLVSDVARLVSSERYTIEQNQQDRDIQAVRTDLLKEIEELRQEVRDLRRDETNTRRWLIATFITFMAFAVALYTKG